MSRSAIGPSTFTSRTCGASWATIPGPRASSRRSAASAMSWRRTPCRLPRQSPAAAPSPGGGREARAAGIRARTRTRTLGGTVEPLGARRSRDARAHPGRGPPRLRARVRPPAPVGSRVQRGDRPPPRVAPAHPVGAAPALRRAPAPPAVPLVRRRDLPGGRYHAGGGALRARWAGLAAGSRPLHVWCAGRAAVDRSWAGGPPDRAPTLSFDARGAGSGRRTSQGPRLGGEPRFRRAGGAGLRLQRDGRAARTPAGRRARAPGLGVTRAAYAAVAYSTAGGDRAPGAGVGRSRSAHAGRDRARSHRDRQPGCLL